MADVQKRKMDDFLKPAAEASKRPRSEEVVVVDDSDVDDQVGLREYLAMEHEDLAEEALRLAERCAVLEADLKLARKAVKTPATAQRGPEQLKVALDRLCGIALKQIGLQRPPASRAKWSYECVCEPDLYRSLLANMKISAEKDKGKVSTQKKVPLDDFFAVLGGSPSGRIRYGTLSVTGDKVIMRYNSDEQQLAFSGTYGL